MPEHTMYTLPHNPLDWIRPPRWQRIIKNQSRDYTNDGEQELEGSVVEESESFAERPNQEIDVGM